jgi:hypothetical protein
MPKATHDPNTDSSRRRFLAIAAGASVVGAGSLAAAAMPAPQCFDDSELLQQEKQILEHLRLAPTYDPEIEPTPESAEHERHWDRHDEAVERMFAVPAQTAEGRGAKASVILGIMAYYMMSDPIEGDYPLDLVRKLMMELGGKPVAQVRSWES